MKQRLPFKKHHIIRLFSHIFWFFVGAGLGLFFLVSFTFIFFQKSYSNRVYPGIFIDGINVGGKTTQDVETLFAQRNEKISDTKFVLQKDDYIATVSAKELAFGFDEKLLAQQAFAIGRSKNLLSDVSLVLQAYTNGINLSPAYHYSEKVLDEKLAPVVKEFYLKPIDALFNFQNGKVTAFQPSSTGQDVDIEGIKTIVESKIPTVLSSQQPVTILIPIPLKVLEPEITTEKVNNLGIKELIGSGTSLFQGSAENRIHNVAVAATKINGVLIKPGEVFSFNKALGDVSVFTGFKQAYVIQNGRTVLGDGGGVCQVSTTFFRAILNAGLPITERHAHAYRVSYYEQDSAPGVDATIYVPSIDLKFKNDTNSHILVQTVIDPTEQRLTVLFYGTSDGREVTLTKPVISSQTPAPEPLYQDDPTLPKGTVKQVDFAAVGAKVSFKREVIKNGKVIIDETFASNYRPWQAVYLRGTQ